MERVLSLEDKIRKAEEIYYRRKNQQMPTMVTQKNTDNNIKQKILKRITTQVLVSVCIFTGVFALLNNNTYSEKIKTNIDTLLSYNIDFESIYAQIGIQDLFKQEEIPLNENEIKIEETLSEEYQEETISIPEEASSLSQMHEDAEYIKQTISLVKPLTGTITSRYGIRENVKPLYHTGIDIAANTGTVVVSAMAGIAEIVSTEGSYGKHIKITNGEISTLYAHCNNLYIKQGDYINQGQQIGEVGSTGNATGPHLHFEIMRNNQCIDPDLILDF